jgi:ATP-dependent helicase/nuclease subunit B
LLTLSAFQHDMRHTNLLALIKHSLCALGLGREILERDAIQIDKMWRGPVRGDLFCERAKFQSLNALYNLSLTYTLFQSETAHPFAEYVEAHISLLEDLAASDTESGSLRLWIGEEGDMAAHFFYQLRQDGALMGDVTATEYAEIFEMLLGKLTLRPRFGTHPRLQITGQIEARLIKADVVILGGLNEGTWPALPPDDPWMSRPMRKSFGLPDLERNIALSAHDFIQAFSASQVVLTRSLRREGTPTVAARWLQRFDVYLQSCGLLPDLLRSGMMKSLAGQLDKPTGLIKPADRPQPSPPLARRPQSLPVTAIETWMRDPYSLYAKYILKLTYLDPVEQESDAALHGQWLHSVLEWFIRQYPNHLPTDSVAQILSFAKEHDKVPRDIALLLPRLQKVVSWFVLREEEWRLRAMVNPQTLEINGTITLENGFVLSAKADRIDSLREGTGSVIIDYKTGSIPTISSVKAGLSPQMSLEGAILNSGGFEGVRVPRTVGLYYLKLGGRHGGVQKEIKATKDETLDDLICQALSGLENLVEKFSDPATAYISLPDPAAAPPEDWQNYAHLARVQEWKTIEDGESAGGEE